MSAGSPGLPQLARRALDGGERGANLVGHRVEEILAQAFGFGQQLRLRRLFAQPLPVQRHGDLPCQRVQQGVMMFRRRNRTPEIETQHPQRAFARGQRHKQRVGARRLARELACLLAMLKHPLRHRLLGSGNVIGARGVPLERQLPLGVRQQHRDLSVEHARQLPHRALQHPVQCRRLRQFARQQVERRGPTLPLPLAHLLRANPRCQLPQHQRHHKIRHKQDQVLHVPDFELRHRFEQKEIPEQGAQRRREQDRPPLDKQGHHNDRQQID